MTDDLRKSLAVLWRRILLTDTTKIFGNEAKRLLTSRGRKGDLIPQPGFVGRNYEQGGLVFVSMNPGKGSRNQDNNFDLGQYKRLEALRDAVEADEIIDRFLAYTDYFHQEWPGPMYRDFIKPILEHAKIDFSSTAYLNLLKWRTENPNGLENLYDLSWENHTGEQFRDLKPRLVVAIGLGAGAAFERNDRKTKCFAIPRAHNNIRPVSGPAKIREIKDWLTKHPLKIHH